MIQKLGNIIPVIWEGHSTHPGALLFRGVIFAQTQTSDLGVCHLRLVGVVIQRDINKF